MTASDDPAVVEARRWVAREFQTGDRALRLWHEDSTQVVRDLLSLVERLRQERDERHSIEEVDALVAMREAAEARATRAEEALQGLVTRAQTRCPWDGYTITKDDPALIEAKAVLTARTPEGAG